MSTYMYLECQDHDPPLRSQDESGQHLYDLPQIFADIRDREFLTREENEHVDWGYFRRATANFLRQHQKCSIKVVDEYGEHHEEPA